jgi:hypothetical protein
VPSGVQLGLDEGDVAGPLRPAGRAPANEVVALYGWGNGTNAPAVTPLDDIHFFPGFYLMSLEEALVSYAAFCHDDRSQPDWLPLFANRGGDFYAAARAASRSPATASFENPLDRKKRQTEDASQVRSRRLRGPGFARG